MEDLTPEAIVSYRFKQALRGYAIEEVDDLLDRLADQVERHLAEIEQLRERLRTAEAASERTRETEATLQRTLVVAQQAAERNLADAAAQAEATVAEATAEAERLRREAADEAHRLRSEADAEAGRVRSDADDHADRVRAEADEHAGRVRSEADEHAGRVRTEADQESTRVLEAAQQAARREVEAARSRIEEAARRHAEVIASVAEHRDALRANLTSLEQLALTPAPEVSDELELGAFAGEVGGGEVAPVEVAGGGPAEDDHEIGELEVHVSHADAWDRDTGDEPAEPWRHRVIDDEPSWPSADLHDREQRTERADVDLSDLAPPTPLTVRVHDQAEPEPHDDWGAGRHDEG